MFFLFLLLVLLFALATIFIGYKVSSTTAGFILLSFVLSKREDRDEILHGIKIPPKLLMIAPIVSMVIIDIAMSLIATYLSNMMVGGVQGNLSITVIILFFILFMGTYVFFTRNEYMKLKKEMESHPKEAMSIIKNLFL